MPTFDFTSPDGKTYSVTGPEGATPEQAFALLQRQIGAEPQSQAPTPAENTISGSAKAIGSGLANAGIGTAGISGDARQLMSNAAGYLGQKLGYDNVGKMVDIVGRAVPGLGGPTSEQIRSAIESKTGPLDYKPQTKLEGYLKTGAEFAPAAFSPGSLVRRAAQVAVPAIASELAGQATQGSAAEPYARTAAAITGAAGAAGAGRAALEAVGGLGTHTGADSLRTAYQAGVKGGQSGEVFRDNLRGIADQNSAIADAKTALNNMRMQKNIEYQSGMTGINKDPTVLKFGDIDSALARMNEVKSFKGQELSKSTTAVRKEISDQIDSWKQLNPSDYHTPAGLDALKQSIGDVMESQPYNTPQRYVAERVYNAIKDTIIKQAPHYAGVMKDYETASNQIRDIERTLSLGKKASSDTALRKLQSVMRNNVNTNFGKRAELAQKLSDNGAPNLMDALAGQANATWMPRGLGKVVAPVLAGSAYFNPLSAVALPFMSPRLMAEGAHALGRASAAAKSIGNRGRALVGLPPSGGILGNALPLQTALALQQLSNSYGR